MVSAAATPTALFTEHTPFAVLLQLEGMVRAAKNQQELQFLFVNETRRLITYRQAVLLVPSGRSFTSYEVRAVSSIPMVDRAAPPVQWLERLIGKLRLPSPDQVIRHVTETDCPIELRPDWNEFTAGHALWCPFKHPDGEILGGLWLTKDHPWPDHEVTVMQRLSEAYAYAWRAVRPTKTRLLPWELSRTSTWLLAAMTVGAFAMPVSMSTLAPAKIVAKDPLIVSAPIDGVIAEIVVLPNSAVSKGDVLFRYEDTSFRNEYRIAERNLDIALAQYRRAAQSSFVETDQKADVPLLKAEVTLRETELNYAHERLAKIEVKAEQSGLVLYTDKSDWVGKPVVIGQRVMELANPKQVEVRIDLAVEYAIVIRQGAPVKLFLDATPLSSLPATISHASYHAEVLPNNVLAYRVMAQLEPVTDEIRIGWRGAQKFMESKSAC